MEGKGKYIFHNYINMSFLGKLLGNNSSSNDNAHIIYWVVNVLNVIEKAGPVLCLFSCEVQVIAGNNVQIRIQDWYDDFIPRFGTEHGLEKFFNLVPDSEMRGIYVSKYTPHISGSPKQFINSLEQALKSNQISGYQRSARFDCIYKSFLE